MNIDLKQNLKKQISNQNLLKELGGTLEKMRYFAVDRKEGIYTILENPYTQKTHKVKTSSLPPFISDGDIVRKAGFHYEFDLQKTNEMKSQIRNKMNGLFEQ